MMQRHGLTAGKCGDNDRRQNDRLAGPSDKRHIGFASAKMKKSYERRSRQLKPKLLL